jgi:hypothetical protein
VRYRIWQSTRYRSEMLLQVERFGRCGKFGLNGYLSKKILILILILGLLVMLVMLLGRFVKNLVHTFFL